MWMVLPLLKRLTSIRMVMTMMMINISFNIYVSECKDYGPFTGTIHHRLFHIHSGKLASILPAKIVIWHAAATAAMRAMRFNLQIKLSILVCACVCMCAFVLTFCFYYFLYLFSSILIRLRDFIFLYIMAFIHLILFLFPPFNSCLHLKQHDTYQQRCS